MNIKNTIKYKINNIKYDTKIKNAEKINENGLYALNTTLERTNGKIYTFEDFIELSTRIINGMPRTSCVIRNNVGEKEKYSIQGGEYYACYPKINGLDAYEKYEIGVFKSSIESVEDKYIEEYGQFGWWRDIGEGMLVLENVPEDVVKKIINFSNIDPESYINILKTGVEDLLYIEQNELAKEIEEKRKCMCENLNIPYEKVEGFDDEKEKIVQENLEKQKEITEQEDEIAKLNNENLKKKE